MNEETTSRLRHLNELKIQGETERIDLIQRCLAESDEKTKKMTNLLSNFESKLTSLHDLVMPVYEATNTLQIKYANIEKTVSQLDSIIEYYDSVKNLSIVIQAGPGNDITSYLSQLNKLKLAIQYFDANRNQSQKRQNEELWQKGKVNVEHEFELLLSKCSDALLSLADKTNMTDDTFDTSSTLDDLIASTGVIKEDDLKQIVSIMQWFGQVDPGFLDNLYEKIISMESRFILESLKKTREKIHSHSTNTITNSSNSTSNGHTSLMQGSISLVHTGGNGQSYRRGGSLSSNTSGIALSNGGHITLIGSPNADERKSTLRNFLFTDSHKKKTLKGTSGIANGDHNGTYGHNTSMTHANGTNNHTNGNSNVNGNNINYNRQAGQVMHEHDVETIECTRFTQCLHKTLKLFSLETKLIGKLLSDDKLTCSKLLERIFDPVLRSFGVEAEKLESNLKQVTSKCTSKYVIAMFNVLKELVQVKTQFLDIFALTNIATKTKRHLSNSVHMFLEVFCVIEQSCVKILRDIIDEIKNDPLNVPPNGNIHPITIDTLSFIENLVPFDTIAGSLANVVVSENQNQMLPSEVEINLRREASKTNESKFTRMAYLSSSESIKRNFRIALSDYITKVFQWLNLNLSKKAEMFMDPYLKAIFLLNNFYKISKLFQSDTQTNNIHMIGAKMSNDISKNKTTADDQTCKTVNDLFRLANKPSLRASYQDKIKEYKREYTKCWDRLLSHIRELNQHNPFGDVKLKDRERQMLKDSFSGFNKEFEEIYETQTRYYIPSEQQDLADMLKQDNSLLIVSQYKKFYDIYSPIDFAKNREKYVKYEPKQLDAHMREFFNAY